jgi:hypothetical protein
VWGGDHEEAARKVHEFFDSPAFQDGVSHSRRDRPLRRDAFSFPSPLKIVALFPLLQIELVPGAVHAIAELSDHFELVIVTSRQHHIEEVCH